MFYITNDGCLIQGAGSSMFSSSIPYGARDERGNGGRCLRGSPVVFMRLMVGCVPQACFAILPFENITFA